MPALTNYSSPSYRLVHGIVINYSVISISLDYKQAHKKFHGFAISTVLEIRVLEIAPGVQFFGV